MLSKTTLILCIQAVVWAVDGNDSHCRVDQHMKYVHCAERKCICSKTIALCQSNEQYNLSYIPRLPVEITHLYFLNNRLPNLTTVTFKNVSRTSIKVLSLVNNKIKSISEDAFSHFNNLRTLCLNQNEDVNKTQLSMSFRRIQTYHRLELFLSNIGLAEVSDGFFVNPMASMIHRLDLSGNRIHVVNWKSFQNLTALTNLSLSENKIREMSTDTRHETLISLNMDWNYFRAETPCFCSASDSTPLFPSLTYLYMNDNFILELNTDSFKCLDQLRHLTLSGNLIRRLRNNVFSGLNKLETLLLSNMGTGISVIEPYAFNNSKLECLSFRENRIHFQPKGQLNIFQLSANLRNLDISLNYLDGLDNDDIMTLLCGLKRLERFTATGTGIRHIPEGLFDVFENLTDVNLDDNKIVKFSGLFDSVKHVKRLSLRGNQIRVVDKSSISEKFLKSVRVLNLRDNPFSCTCENMLFMSMLNSKGVIGNVSLTFWPFDYHCASPSDLQGTLLKDYHPTESSCNTNNFLLIVTILLGTVFIVSVVATVLGYKYRWYVKYWFYKHKSNRRTSEEVSLLEQNFDAFFIYNLCDSQYVHHDVRLLLEEERAYKLHIWERDVPAGSDNFRSLVSGIEASRRVIAVISKESLEDNWFQFQLSVALGRQVELKRQFLIFVILENVEFEGLSRYWCVLLTRFPTSRWCHDKADVKRAVFEQQLFNHLCRRKSK